MLVDHLAMKVLARPMYKLILVSFAGTRKVVCAGCVSCKSTDDSPAGINLLGQIFLQQK